MGENPFAQLMLLLLQLHINTEEMVDVPWTILLV